MMDLEDTRAMARTYVSDEDFNSELEKVVKTEFGKDFKSDAKDPALNKLLCFSAHKDPDGKRELYYCVLAISGDDWDNWEKRSKYIEALGVRFSVEERKQIGMVFMASEVWMATVKPGEEMSQPSKHPSRQEAVMISGMTVDRRMNTAIAFLNEDRTLAEFNYRYYDESESDVETVNNRMLSTFFLGHIKGQIANSLKR